MFFLPPLAPAAVSDATSATGGAAPVAPPLDPTTGRPVPLRDETGQPLVQKDDTGQPLPPPEEEETPLQRPDSLLRQSSGAFTAEERERLRDALIGGPDWRLQFAVTEGYNTNVFQTQNVVNGPVTRHPSAFTGVDASAEWLSWTSVHDQQSFRLEVRGQHYEPLDGDSISDDGSVNASFRGQFTLSPRTYVITSAFGTITSTNSAQISDGPLFLVDPSSLQRTYTLETARLSIVHELSPTWRVIAGADVEVSTTIHDVPIQLDQGTEINHQGLDYVTPAADVALFHDLGEADIVTAMLRYEPTYIAFLVNPLSVPPQYNGYTTIQMGEASAGWIHAFNEHFRSWTTVGAIVASQPPLDTQPGAVLSPQISEELTYTNRSWITVFSASYSYGSVNPRIGFGPTTGMGVTMEGIPYPHGRWNNLSVLASAAAARSVLLETETEISRLTNFDATVEGRYALNRWLGVMAGYQTHFVDFEGADAYPTMLRHVVFVGLSGYFAGDRAPPMLNTFTSPVNPPG